ncbi:hypothetical protein [Streptomyces sp. SBT349]|uniref:hypothetical protein n=1 Tax=Streptomyces sp. SBT349 TaxID=1580539 RepID=UPI00066E4F14|nr:hypothetical protein [Streptomyces sp. SBT349]
MTAVARYALADYLRSQRFVAPLVVLLGFLAVLHAFPGSVVSGYGASAAALVPIGVWLTLGLHNAEDPLQTEVTIANAGGRRRVVIGKTCAALAAVLALAAVALVWPLVSAGRPYPPADLAAGLLAHLTCGVTGVALGTCCARPLIRRQGHAFATALLLSLVALVSRPLSPANRTIRLMSAAPPRPSAAELLLLAAWALVLLAVLAPLSSWAGQRRR